MPPKKQTRPDRPEIKAKRGAHGWTPPKRRTIYLMRTELDLTQDQVVILMHDCFPDMLAVGYNAAWKHFNDVYRGRNDGSHAFDWTVIARPRPAITTGPLKHRRAANLTPYTATELAEFARIRGIVHAFAIARGIPIKFLDPNDGQLGGPHLAPGQVVPQVTVGPLPLDCLQAATKARRAAAKGAKSSNTAATGAITGTSKAAPKPTRKRPQRGQTAGSIGNAQHQAEFYGPPIMEDGYNIAMLKRTQFRSKLVKQRRPEATPTALDMVHHGTLRRAELKAGGHMAEAYINERFNATSERYLAHDEDTQRDRAAHAGGGSVLRVFFPEEDDSPAHFADTMVCNASICGSFFCRNVPDDAASSTENAAGLPFVHLDDCIEHEDGKLEFYPEHATQPTPTAELPTQTAVRDITFHNGFEQIVLRSLVCKEGKCVRCKAQKDDREAGQVENALDADTDNGNGSEEDDGAGKYQDDAMLDEADDSADLQTDEDDAGDEEWEEDWASDMDPEYVDDDAAGDNEARDDGAYEQDGNVKEPAVEDVQMMDEEGAAVEDEPVINEEDAADMEQGNVHIDVAPQSHQLVSTSEQYRQVKMPGVGTINSDNGLRLAPAGHQMSTAEIDAWADADLDTNIKRFDGLPRGDSGFDIPTFPSVSAIDAHVFFGAGHDVEQASGGSAMDVDWRQGWMGDNDGVFTA